MAAKHHGLILIDKSPGMTSHDVVQKLRRILQQKEVGHAGTLDPLASGLLVMMLGEATKLSDFVLNGDKSYEVLIELGKTTDTLDRDGTILTQVENLTVADERITAAINELIGPLELAVPQYSAVKLKGRKLYDYARQGETVEAPLRTMEFRDVSWLSRDGNFLRIAMTCSKGSYVRSWAQRLGEKLGCGAIVSELRRVFSAPYHCQAAVRLEDLLAMSQEGGVRFSQLREQGAFVDLSNSLPAWPAVHALGPEVRLIENGVIAGSLKGKLAGSVRHSSVGKILSTDGRKLLALVVTDEYSNVKIRRVFRYEVDA